MKTQKPSGQSTLGVRSSQQDVPPSQGDSLCEVKLWRQTLPASVAQTRNIPLAPATPRPPGGGSESSQVPLLATVHSHRSR